MKKFSITILLLAAVMCGSAQSQWTKPVDDTQATETTKTDSKTIDPKYAQGAVPEVDGKITWQHTYDLPGQSADQIYDKALAFFQKFVKGKDQTENSLVAVVNKDLHQIGVRPQEWLIFADKFLMLDRARMSYNIVADCSDGKCAVKITNIHYNYEEDREQPSAFLAEEKISDKVSFNKKGTAFTKGGTKKFRTKTIDRMELIISEIGEGLK